MCRTLCSPPAPPPRRAFRTEHNLPAPVTAMTTMTLWMISLALMTLVTLWMISLALMTLVTLWMISLALVTLVTLWMISLALVTLVTFWLASLALMTLVTLWMISLALVTTASVIAIFPCHIGTPSPLRGRGRGMRAAPRTIRHPNCQYNCPNPPNQTHA